MLQRSARRAAAKKRSAVARVYATWDPANKNVNVTLSNGNLTASNMRIDRAVKSTISKSAGKWYWEYQGAQQGGWYLQDNGIGRAGASVNGYTGQTIDSWGYDVSGVKSHNGVDSAYGAAYSNHVIGVKLDCDNHTIEFLKNNVSQGVAFADVTGAVFAMSSGGSTTLSGPLTANFGASPFAYSVPAGYNAGLFI
jgi:hypothetical protein